MITLRNYQKDAIAELKQKLSKLLKLSGSHVNCVFKAPTGSGKTLMVSETLRQLVSDGVENHKLSFIWVAVRMLHEQSKDRLESYYQNDRKIRCSYFSDLRDNSISENEVLFINWSSINQRNKNILIRDNEEDRNLTTVIRNTKDAGRTVILVIDESHHTADSERSRELMNIISPKVTLYVSATPKHVDGELVNVDIQSVKEEEMIKSEVVINPKFSDVKIGTETANNIVIREALKKREELTEYFAAVGSNVNPLLMIQLPDKRSELDTMKDDVIELLDDKYDINEDNGKLAVWLSEEKSGTLVNIDKPDNEVQVLVFKQAISLGWDCPRASILVIFRELTSFIFTIQTIGRIMRMPELKYYDKDTLNQAYVYTNLPSINIEEDVIDYVSINESLRNKTLYEDLSLTSYFIKRTRERTRLSGDFIRTFQDEAKKASLDTKVNRTPDKLVEFVLSDGKIDNIDKTGKVKADGKVSFDLSSKEVNRFFDLFIWQQCSPFAPVDSSDRLKNALYTFLKDKLNINKYSTDAQKIVLDYKNLSLFEQVIQSSKDRYIEEIVKTAKEKGDIVKNPQWEVPEIISYNQKYIERPVSKSIMQPFYEYDEVSKPEKDFIDFLESERNNVIWWFKNRENESKYFAVYYQNDDGFPSSFYVDFIVKFKNGTIGLFDTKSGITASVNEAKAKAEALQNYVEEEKSLGKKIRGGIVIPHGSPNYITWRINENKNYTDDFNNSATWKPFVL